jgi:hypothetical protein
MTLEAETTMEVAMRMLLALHRDALSKLGKEFIILVVLLMIVS